MNVDELYGHCHHIANQLYTYFILFQGGIVYIILSPECHLRSGHLLGDGKMLRECLELEIPSGSK